MNIQSFKQKSGVALTGLAATVTIWVIAMFLDAFFVPKLAIVSWLRMVLILMFLMDIVYLTIGSIRQLNQSGWGKSLATEGPYQFVRHPLYSGIIYSLTGLLAVLQFSWSLLLSVLPLSLFWSWLVQAEERWLLERFGNKYRQYMAKTGQFYPTTKSLVAERK